MPAPSPHGATTAPCPPPTAPLWLALCRAVSDDTTALLIGPDNRAAGRVRVTAAAAGRCVAVVARADLLTVDADTPDAVAALDEITARLTAAAITPVVIDSGGPGRRHLFAHVPDARLRTELVQVAVAAGGDVRHRSPLRPPGTPHRTGTPARLVTPATWTDALAALTAHPDSGHRAGRPGPTRRDDRDRRRSGRLSAVGWSTLRDGDTDGRYRRGDGTVDESRVVLAVCNAAVAAGWTRDRTWTVLLDPGNAGGAGLRRRHDDDPAAAGRWFDRTWATATGTPRTAPIRGRDDALAELDRIAELADTVPFPGRCGSSDRTVLFAAVELARTQGGVVARLSVRALAEASGRTRRTVEGALRRLTAGGWLTRVAAADGDHAATWRVSAPNCLNLTPTGGRGTGAVRRGVDDPGHDGFATGALGPGAWRVLRALTAAPATAATIAATTGQHPGSVRRLLRRLETAGLVTGTDGVWTVTATDPDDLGTVLDDVAEHAGTAGRRDRIRARHRHERAQWRTRRARAACRTNRPAAPTRRPVPSPTSSAPRRADPPPTPPTRRHRVGAGRGQPPAR